MSNEVTDLLSALRDGSMSLAEVARRFRERTWPAAKPPPPSSYLEMAEAAQRDPRPDVSGTFDDVIAAYGRGELTLAQYQELGKAVAESKRAERGKRS